MAAGRFVIDCDPTRGGQVIVASIGLDQPVKMEIKERYSELIAKAEKGTCYCVCPLRDGRYAVAYAYRVGASRNEFRKHEIIRGMVVSQDELADISQYLASNQLEKLFFPEEPDPNFPDDWVVPEHWNQELHDNEVLSHYLNHMEYDKMIGIIRALKEIEKSGYKVQLLIPEGMRALIMAVLNRIALQSRVRLFLLADGECTLQDPDIVLVEKLEYLDARKYHRMTLEGLASWGNSLGKNTGLKKCEKEEKREQKIKALVDLCRAYVLDAGVSSYELQGRIQDLHETYGSGVYESFLRKLRSALYQFEAETMCQESFMELLYMCFYCPCSDAKKVTGMEIKLVYDYPGMLHFIRKKATNKHQLKKMTAAMLKFQFAACLTEMDEKFLYNETMKMLKK